MSGADIFKLNSSHGLRRGGDYEALSYTPYYYHNSNIYNRYRCGW